MISRARFFVVVFFYSMALGNAWSQDLGYKEIQAPFKNDFVFFELYGMIYEPGMLKNISLFVSPNSGEEFTEATQAYLLFSSGKEFHFGNLDSLEQNSIKIAPLEIEDYSAFRLNSELKIYIDQQWLADVMGELQFKIVWDAMGEFGQLESDNVVFRMEAQFDYDDASILEKSGIISSFTDPRDGHEYRTVQIGEAIWMRDNLVYEANFSKKKNDFLDRKKEGLTYSWWNAKQACPAGWRLPTESDFMYLKSYYENERQLLPGGVSKLNLESIFYNTYWEFWTSTPDEGGYIKTFKFEWGGLESQTNKTRGTYYDVGDWDKSLIRCVKK
ncbi:MAG: FISUMP domain-containing protein [Vicingaceae bacterium]